MSSSSIHPANLSLWSLSHAIHADFAASQVLPFDRSASDVFASLRAERVRIATMDLRIAAIAISNGLILLSRNTSDFGKVPGLRVEDWTLPVS